MQVHKHDGLMLGRVTYRWFCCEMYPIKKFCPSWKEMITVACAFTSTSLLTILLFVIVVELFMCHMTMVVCTVASKNN